MINNLIEKIIQHPLFLKLKDVVEKNAWHDHENVYSHSIKTKDIALREIKAEFITNPQAKQGFLNFIGEDFHRFKRSDLMLLITLLHDIGKMLHIKEGNKAGSLEITNNEGITSAPGHAYWGSTIVGRILYDLSLDDEVVTYITQGVKVHDAFQGDYLPAKKGQSIEAIINDVKSGAEGMYIESMFNNYCDVFTAPPFQPYKQLVINIFNEPSLYERREYVIP